MDNTFKAGDLVYVNVYFLGGPEFSDDNASDLKSLVDQSNIYNSNSDKKYTYPEKYAELSPSSTIESIRFISTGDWYMPWTEAYSDGLEFVVAMRIPEMHKFDPVIEATFNRIVEEDWKKFKKLFEETKKQLDIETQEKTEGIMEGIEGQLEEISTNLETATGEFGRNPPPYLWYLFDIYDDDRSDNELVQSLRINFSGEIQKSDWLTEQEEELRGSVDALGEDIRKAHDDLQQYLLKKAESLETQQDIDEMNKSVKGWYFQDLCLYLDDEENPYPPENSERMTLLYIWIKQHLPEINEKIRELNKEGRLTPANLLKEVQAFNIPNSNGADESYNFVKGKLIKYHNEALHSNWKKQIRGDKTRAQEEIANNSSDAEAFLKAWYSWTVENNPDLFAEYMNMSEEFNKTQSVEDINKNLQSGVDQAGSNFENSLNDLSTGLDAVMSGVDGVVLGFSPGEPRPEFEFTSALTDFLWYADRINEYNEDMTKLGNKINVILITIMNIGMVLSVLMSAFIGVKYMLGSAEEKADYKKDLIPYIVGAILLFGISVVVKVLLQIGQSINNI